MDLEKVEKLRATANVTYEEAKNALQKTNGDLLEAVIELERQGKIKEPSGGGYYSSRENKSDETSANANGYDYQQRRGARHARPHRQPIKDFLHWCGRIIQKGNTNYLDITKCEEPEMTPKLITSIPLTILVLLLFFAFWATIPAMVVLLFLGYRYSFRGPEIGRDDLNRAMNKAAETIDNIKAEVKEGME